MKRLSSFFIFHFSLIFTLSSCATFKMAKADIVIKTAKGTTREEKGKQLLQDIIEHYKVQEYFYTDKIFIEEGAIPHSHPVLTLNTRLIDNKDAFLSSFIHEQIHWYLSQSQLKEKLQKFIVFAKKQYPQIPVGKKQGGARDNYSSYLHLAVNFLEYEGLKHFVGKARALKWFYDKKVYGGLNEIVLRDMEILKSKIYSLGLNVILKKRISLSFDDAPMGDSYYYTGAKRAEELIAALRRAKVDKVIFYANPGKINSEEKSQRLVDYKKAGHLIGNHTQNHISAEKVTVNTFLDDFLTADDYLRKNGLLSTYFRYPYLRRGEEINDVRKIREEIIKKGYTDAYVTIDNYDWYMNSLFQESVKNGEAINFEKLKQFYIETLMKSVEFYDELALKTLDRSPRHVLLLHENDLAALFIDDFIVHLRQSGWEISTPEYSYGDPDLSIYPDIEKHNQGRVVSKAIELGYKGKLSSGYEDEKVLEELYERYGVSK